jgi:hypothetical protein
VLGTTADKTVSSYQVTGYDTSSGYFQLRTFTLHHGYDYYRMQQNELWSDYTQTFWLPGLMLYVPTVQKK